MNSQFDKKRYKALDILRGFTLISMILYHGMWDLIYMAGFSVPWYSETPGYLWQQSICLTFILLSGFCQPLGRKKVRRALTVSGAGLLVTAVTLLFMPQNRVVFGVLTLIGSCMLFWALLEKKLSKVPALWGLAGSLFLFIFTRDTARGCLGFFGLQLLALPEELYANLFTAWLGFPFHGFFSTDYFPVLPWLFLYSAGAYLHRLMRESKCCASIWSWLETPGLIMHIPLLSWIGRNSLVIYLLHQPLLYGMLMIWQAVT